MASESPQKRLQEEATCCPICSEYFTDPVTLACLHTFCCACVSHSHANALCPLCERDSHTESVNGQEEARRYDICRRHREPMKRFCKDDEVLICTSCEEEHRDHKILPMEEAAKEYKDCISASLDALKKHKERLMVIISAKQAESEDLFKQMATERQKMVARYGDLWQILKSQEESTLAQMKGIEEQMEKETNEYIEELDQPASTLGELILEMEEKRLMPPSLLLQDIGSLLKRSEQKVELKDPGDFPCVLKQKLSTFTDSRPSLVRAIKKLKDTVATCY